VTQRPKETEVRISPEWCSHPAYISRLEALCEAADVGSLPVKERSDVLKDFARDAAKHARDVMFECAPESKVATLLRLSSISRAVWSGDLKLYNILVHESQLGRDHLCLLGGIPTLRNPGAFEEAFRAAKLEAAKQREAAIRAEHDAGGRTQDFDKARRNTRLKINTNLAKLWTVASPAFVLRGVTLSGTEASECGIDLDDPAVSFENGFIKSTNPDHYFAAFSSVWGKVFGHNDTDTDLAQVLLETYIANQTWDWSKLIHPNLEIVEFILSRLKSTAPGLDGITNAAWKYGGKHIARYILDLLDAFCEDGELPGDINLSLMVFLAKGGDGNASANIPDTIFNHPAEMRPLSLKQGDNKLVASVLNYCISPAISASAIDMQRGFIHGRQLAQNVIDLDFSSRMFALDFYSGISNPTPMGIDTFEMFVVPSAGIVKDLPLTVLFDFASAFPSVAHAWLFAVLEAIRLWPAFLRAIRNLYKGNLAYGRLSGLLRFLFPILAGVLQGCPLSGTLFAFVADPLLWMFRMQMNSAVVRACADDIGAALRKLRELAILAKIFEDFRKASNLTLKPAKCIMILTACGDTSANIGYVRRWLETNIPGWRGMKIQACAKYLGFYLGPKAGGSQWVNAMGKFHARCSQTKQDNLPIKLAISRFNTRAVPVLGYLAQLVSPPPNIVRLELTGILQSLKLAGNSMNASCAYKLKAWFDVDPLRPSIYMEACMIRAAWKTFQGCEDMHKKLEEKASLSLSLPQACAGSLPSALPPGWDSRAFCSNLHDACHYKGLRYAAECKAGLSRVYYHWKAGNGNLSLQKEIYNVLCKTVDGAHVWTELINDKLGILVGEAYNNKIFLRSDLVEFINGFRKCPSSCQTSIFKTLINSWATTYRFNENNKLPCIFGCTDAKDELQHYLCCPPMWTIAASSASLPTVYLSLSPPGKGSACSMSMPRVSGFLERFIEDTTP